MPLELLTIVGPLQDPDFAPGTKVPRLGCPELVVLLPMSGQEVTVPASVEERLAYAQKQPVPLLAVFRGSDSNGVLAHVRSSRVSGDHIVLDLASQVRVRRRGDDIELLGYSTEPVAQHPELREAALGFLELASGVAAVSGRDLSEVLALAPTVEDTGDLIDLVSSEIAMTAWRERAAILNAADLHDRARVASEIWQAQRPLIEAQIALMKDFLASS